MTSRVTLPDQALLVEVLDYDPDTGCLLWKVRGPHLFVSGRGGAYAADRWNKRWAGKFALININPSGYLVGEIFDKPHRAHRIIWKMVHGVDPIEVDHIDGCRTNNRLVNLRNVTRLENRRNASLRYDSRTGVNGVTWDTARGKWYASIAVAQKTISLGRHDTFEGAIRARKAGEAELGFHKNHGRSTRA